MAMIDIERAHNLGLAGIRELMEHFAAGLHERYGLERHWQGDVLQLSGSGVSGAITVTARAVRVTAELGFLLRPLRGRIEQDIHARLDRHLR